MAKKNIFSLTLDNNKLQVLTPEETIRSFNEGQVYFPAKENYDVINNFTGKKDRVNGIKLPNLLRTGHYSLKGSSSYDDTVKSLKEESGGFEAFSRGFAHSLTLGFLNETSNLQKSSYGEILDSVYREQFGAATSSGRIAGFVAPLLVPGGKGVQAGVGGALKAGARIGKGVFKGSANVAKAAGADIAKSGLGQAVKKGAVATGGFISKKTPEIISKPLGGFAAQVSKAAPSISKAITEQGYKKVIQPVLTNLQRLNKTHPQAVQQAIQIGKNGGKLAAGVARNSPVALALKATLEIQKRAGQIFLNGAIRAGIKNKATLSAIQWSGSMAGFATAEGLAYGGIEGFVQGGKKRAQQPIFETRDEYDARSNFSFSKAFNHGVKGAVEVGTYALIFGAGTDLLIKGGSKGLQVAKPFLSKVGRKGFETLSKIGGEISEATAKRGLKTGEEVVEATGKKAAETLGDVAETTAKEVIDDEPILDKFVRDLGSGDFRQAVNTYKKKFQAGFYEVTDDVIKFRDMKENIAVATSRLADLGEDVLNENILRDLYGSLPPAIKKRLGGVDPSKVTKDFLNKNRQDIIKNLDKENFANYLDTLGAYSSGGKIPQTRQEFLDLSENLKIETGQQIQEAQAYLRDLYSGIRKDAVKRKKHLILENESKIDGIMIDLTATLPKGQKAVKELIEGVHAKPFLKWNLSNTGNIEKVFKNKKTMEDAFNQYVLKRDGQIDMLEITSWKKNLPAIKKDIQKTFNLKDKQSVDEFSEILRKHIDESEDFLKVATDANSMYYYLNKDAKQGLNTHEISELDHLIERVYKAKPKTLKPLRDKVKKHLDKSIDLELPEQFMVSSVGVGNTIRKYMNKISDVQKVLSPGAAYSKLNKMNQYIKQVQENKKVSIITLMDLNKHIDDFVQWGVKKGDLKVKDITKLRSLRHDLAGTVQDRINQIARSTKKQIPLDERGRQILKNLEINNSKYMLSLGLEGIAIESVSKAKGIFSGRDITLTLAGTFGPGTLLGAAGYYFGGWAGGIAGFATGSVGGAAGVDQISQLYKAGRLQRTASNRADKILSFLDRATDDFLNKPERYISGKGGASIFKKASKEGAIPKAIIPKAGATPGVGAELFKNVKQKGRAVYDTVSDGVKKYKDDFNVVTEELGKISWDVGRLYHYLKPNDYYSDEKETPKNFEEFANEIKNTEGHEIAMNEDIGLMKVMRDYGGEEAEADFVQKRFLTKQMLIGDLPKGTYNEEEGVLKFSKIEELTYYNTIDKYMNPKTFIKSIEEGTLTKTQIEKFKEIYPQIYQNIIMELEKGTQEKSIKITRGIRRSLDILRGKDRVAFFMNFDSVQANQQQQQSSRQRRGGIKFTTYTQPTREDRIRTV